MRHDSLVWCNTIHHSTYLESMKLNHSIGKTAAFAEDQIIFKKEVMLAVCVPAA